MLQVALNALGFLGWLSVAVLFLLDFLHASLADRLPDSILRLAFVSELVCVFEVVQIAIGIIPGRLVLGVVLHYTRLLILIFVIYAKAEPNYSEAVAAKLIISAWAVTEVGRYPMLLVRKAPPKVLFLLRAIRFTIPAVTFPWGSGAEAWAAWLSLEAVSGTLLWYLLAFVVPVNVIGGLASYVGILQKATQSWKPEKKKVEEGVLFPADAEGKRSTISGGKAVWASAVEAVDEKIARAIAKEKAWRQNYAKHVVAAAETSCRSKEAAVNVASAGLAAMYDKFEFVRSGRTMKLAAAMEHPTSGKKFYSSAVQGTGELSKLTVPYAGQLLSGGKLMSQLRTWTSYGCAEPAAMDAIEAAVANPEWFDLRNYCFVIMGATSAMGPLQHLLSWGATVIAIARPNNSTWKKLIADARGSPGKLIFPTRSQVSKDADDDQLARQGGADLLVDTPEIAAWLNETLPDVIESGITSITLGVYVYLDGDAHVRVSLACDAIISSILASSIDKAKLLLAYMQTPSLTYVISEDAHKTSLEASRASSLPLIGFPANARPACPSEGSCYIHDGLINLQGPNYALAKTMQLWRAVVAHTSGIKVSMNVAPAARTASMVAGKNKNAGTVAKSLDGMSHFPPLVVFDSDTVAACMAAMLVHDVRSAATNSFSHPWELASRQAFHGGSFRLGIKPEALGPLFVLYGYLFGSTKQPIA